MFAAALAALITIIPAQQRFGRDITVVVDCSGSMVPGVAQSRDYYGDAIRTAVEVIQGAATDESRVRVITFGDRVAESEWHEWPVDCDAVAAWLAARRPTAGTMTYLDPALVKALEVGDAIVISDGVAYDGLPRLLATLKDNPGRVVAAIHVGDPGGLPLMRAIGQAGRGGTYRVEPAPKPGPGR